MVNLCFFFRCQGAIVASLQPEFLLDKDDFKRFVLIKREDMTKAGISVTFDSVERELERYETCSKRAWTDLLLQIIKVGYCSIFEIALNMKVTCRK